MELDDCALMLETRLTFACAALVLAASAFGCSSKANDSASAAAPSPPPSPPPDGGEWVVEQIAPKPSRDLDVSELAPSMSVQSNGAGIVVYAALLGSVGFVELVDEDRLFASIEESNDKVPMERQPDTERGVVRYWARFSARSEATNFIVSFERPGGRRGAPASRIALAAAFEIVDPPESMTAGARLEIETTMLPGAGVTPKLRLDADCIDHSDHALALVEREGKLELAEHFRVNTALDCPVHASVRYETRGVADPAFAKGLLALEGLQARSFDMIVTH